MTTQFDAAIEFQLDAMRVSASTQREVDRILRALERDLIGRLSGPLTEWSRARIKKQLAEVRATIASFYDDAAAASTGAAVTVAEVGTRATAAALALGGDAVVLPSAAVLETLAGNAIVQGAVQQDWWNRQAADVAFRFAGAIRQGVAAAETNQQIVARLRAVMDVSKANAAALVQTSVATVANDARQVVFDANADLIKRYRAVATLDTATCTRCAPLDGLEWLPNGDGIGHSVPKPRYPLHYNCRCLLIAQVLDGPPGGQRASDAGPVSASLTFEGWLERQPAAKVAEVLGKGRAELYRAGKITLTDLTNGAGRPLALADLRRKYTGTVSVDTSAMLRSEAVARQPAYTNLKTLPAVIEGAPITKKALASPRMLAIGGSSGIAVNTSNKAKAIWADIAAYQQKSFDDGWLSSPNPSHTIWHELGHYKFKNSATIAQDSAATNRNAYNPIFKATAEKVSRYAATNGQEFIAEVYAGIRAGMAFDQDVIRLYLQLNGPGFRE